MQSMMAKGMRSAYNYYGCRKMLQTEASRVERERERERGREGSGCRDWREFGGNVTEEKKKVKAKN